MLWAHEKRINEKRINKIFDCSSCSSTCLVQWSAKQKKKVNENNSWIWLAGSSEIHSDTFSWGISPFMRRAFHSLHMRFTRDSHAKAQLHAWYLRFIFHRQRCFINSDCRSIFNSLAHPLAPLYPSSCVLKINLTLKQWSCVVSHITPLLTLMYCTLLNINLTPCRWDWRLTNVVFLRWKWLLFISIYGILNCDTNNNPHTHIERDRYVEFLMCFWSMSWI